jgi:hypothetical protein
MDTGQALNQFEISEVLLQISQSDLDPLQHIAGEGAVPRLLGLVRCSHLTRTS